MKYLKDYMDEEISQLLDEVGAFFAFSDKQFNEAKKEDVDYVSLHGGLIAPKAKAKYLLNKLDLIHKNAIKKDLKENGKEQIIKRELYNHESFYVSEYQTAAAALAKYGVSENEVARVYYNERFKL